MFVLIGLESIVQVLIVSFMMVVAGKRVVRAWFWKRFSSEITRGLVITGVISGIVALLLWVVPRNLDGPVPLVEPPCDLLGESAAGRLGLSEGVLLLDPRPLEAFAAYHLEGSCRIPLSDLDRPETIRLLHRAREVLLVDDVELPPHVAFREGLPERLSDVRWGSLPGGLKHHYKPPGPLVGYGVGKAQQHVVDANGESVSLQVGPFWFMGFYRWFLDHPDWRLRPASTVKWAHEHGISIVDLRVDEADASPVDLPAGATFLPPWNAYLTEAERAFGKPIEELLVVCSGPNECLGGEAIAAQLLNRGGSIHGYVHSDEPLAKLLERPAIPGSPFALALMSLVSFALGVFVFRSWARKLHHARATGAVGGPGSPTFVSHALQPLLAFTTLAVVEVASYLAPFSRSNGHIDRALLSAQGAGMTPALLVALILLLLLARRAASGPANRWIHLATIALVFAWIEVVQVDVFGVTLAGAILGLAHVSGVLTATANRLGLLPGRHRNPDLIVELAAAADLESAGAKARWLGKVLQDGLRVPPGLVHLTTAEPHHVTSPEVVQRIVSQLGPGPWVVRSTAPDEDLNGAETAGRYASVIDVCDEAGLRTAIHTVITSYLENGIAPGTRVGVLIQMQVSGPLAGVAVREPEWRGGGLLLEASAGLNTDITGGRGAEWRDRIGRFSETWLLGGMAGGRLKAETFVDLFFRLEARFSSTRLNVEWTSDTDGLVVLQVRPAPVEAQPAPRSDLANAYASLTGAMRWLHGQPRRTVLETGNLTELQGVSTASSRLIQDLWDPDGPPRRASKLLGLRWSPSMVRRPIISIDNTLHANRTIDNPIAFHLFRPLLRVFNWLLTLRCRRHLEAIDQRLRRLESALPGPPDAASDARSAVRTIFACRDSLLGEPATLAVAISRLETLRNGALTKRPITDGDPLLDALSCNPSPERLAAEHPHRSTVDLALEKPRFGELHDMPGRWPSCIDAPPLASDSLQAVRQIRGRARAVLAQYAARLRMAHLELSRLTQRLDVFDWSSEEMAGILEGRMPLSRPRGAAVPELVPASISLAEFEGWVAEGVFPERDGSPRSRGVWIGAPSNLTGTITRQIPSAPGSILLVKTPTADLVSRLAPGQVLMAASGSALCHAALVAQQRGVLALFGVGTISDLREGDVVHLSPKGRVELLRRNPAPPVASDDGTSAGVPHLRPSPSNPLPPPDSALSG